jgi:RHS repeat-associated protein
MERQTFCMKLVSALRNCHNVTEQVRGGGKNTCTALAILSVFLLAVCPLTAQVLPDAGIQMWSTNDFGISLATSAINVNIPLRSKIGAIPFSSSLFGTSQAYVFTEGTGTGIYYTFGGIGGYSDSTSVAAMFSGVTISNCSGQPTETTYKYTILSITDPTGAAHPLGNGIFNVWTFSQYCAVTPSPLVTTDGSGYTFVASTNSGGLSGTFTIYDRSGAHWGGSCNPTTNGCVMTGPTVVDPDGNSISGTSFNEGNVTDTLGTTALTLAVNGTTLSYSYLDPSGTTSQYYTLSSSNVGNLKTNFNCPYINDWSFSNFTPYTSLTTPTGGKYLFTYEPTPNGNGFTNTTPPTYFTGRIGSITFPSGGSITYSYSGGNNGIVCNHGIVPTITVTTNDSNGNINTYSYVNTVSSSSNYFVMKTDPAGNQTLYYFSGQVQTKVMSYQGGCSKSIYSGCSGAAPNTLLRTVMTCYNGNLTNCATPSSAPTLPIKQTDVYTSLNTSSSNHVQTIYDCNASPTACYGNIVEVSSYDFGGTTLISQTFLYYGQSWNSNSSACNAYASGTYINNTPCYVDVKNSSGDVAKTQITYSSTGHPTAVSRWVSGTTWLASSATFNSNGTMATVTDAANNTTNFGYTGTGECNGLLLTSTSYPNGLTTAQAWNCSGGVLTSSTDANGQAALYGYKNESGTADPSWRRLSVTDPLGNKTWTDYSPGTTLPQTVETYLNFPVSNPTSTLDTLNTLDGFGRTVKSQKRTAPNVSTFDSTVLYTYGWQSASNGCTSTPPFTTGPCMTQTVPGGTALTTTNLDALGRTANVTDGGGGSTGYSFTNNDALMTLSPAPSGENPKKRQMEYDGSGRLTSACELTGTPNGGGTCTQSNSQTGYWTKYTYDALNNLLSVSQNAQGSYPQSRGFTRDGLGRLLSESNPETGTASYTYDTDGTCGTYKGDLVKKVDAVGNVTCFAYDQLHRLTGETYPSGSYASVTPSKTFVYDTLASSFTCTGTTTNYPSGRLAEAYTGSSSSKTTDIAYCYNARGDSTDAFESTPNSGGYYHTTTSFFANGGLNTLNGVPGLNGWTYTADGEGRPYSTTYGSSADWVKTTLYYPSQPTTTTVTFGSGSTDQDTYTFDTNTGRMKGFVFTVGVSQTTLTGTVGWNSNGTLGSLGITDQFNSSNTQSCNFTYDDLGRLAGKNSNGYSVDCGSGGWQQLFSLDPFGNISMSGSGTFAASYVLANGTTNNQEQSVGSCVPSYDANGNMTKDCSFASPPTYSWDSDGNPVTLRGYTLTHDAFDRLVEFTSGSSHTQTLWGPVGKLGTMNGQTAKNIRVPLPGGSLGELYSGGGQTHILHADWLGSARLSTTFGNRTMAYDTAYSPYGQYYANAGSSSTDLDFTGQFQDTMTGLFDFQAREYDPDQGRWIAPDPAGLRAVDPSQPQTWNRYGYVVNNPVALTDPMGLFSGGGGGNPCVTDCPNPIPPSPCDTAVICGQAGVNCSIFGGITCDPCFVYGCDPPMAIDPDTVIISGQQQLLPGQDCVGCWPIGPSPGQILQAVLSGNVFGALQRMGAVPTDGLDCTSGTCQVNPIMNEQNSDGIKPCKSGQVPTDLAPCFTGFNEKDAKILSAFFSCMYKKSIIGTVIGTAGGVLGKFISKLGLGEEITGPVVVNAGRAAAGVAGEAAMGAAIIEMVRTPFECYDSF